MGLFLGSVFCSIDHISVFVTVPHCFDYCSFVVLSEVWDSYASCFVLLLKFYLFIYLFIYLFMAVLGFCCCAQAFSSCGEWELLFVVVHGLLIAVASLVVEHRL